MGSVRIPGCRIPLFLFCTSYLLEGNHPAKSELSTSRDRHRPSREPLSTSSTSNRGKSSEKSSVPRHTVGGEEDPEFAKTPQCSQMTDRWSRAKKEIFNKLIEATSCGETVILVKNCAASDLFLGNSGSCSGLHNLPIGGKEKGEKAMWSLFSGRDSPKPYAKINPGNAGNPGSLAAGIKPAGRPGDKALRSKDPGPTPRGTKSHRQTEMGAFLPFPSLIHGFGSR